MFPNVLPTAPLFLSPSPFCFLHGPSPPPGLTSPHPYSHALLLLMSPCPSCVAPPRRSLVCCPDGGPQPGRSWKMKEVQLLPLGMGCDGKKVHGNLPFSQNLYFSSTQELLLDELQLCVDVEESRNAINSRCQSFCLQTLGIVGLGQAPHSPLQTKRSYLGDPLGRSTALLPSLFIWMAPCVSQPGKPAD